MFANRTVICVLPTPHGHRLPCGGYGSNGDCYTVSIDLLCPIVPVYRGYSSDTYGVQTRPSPDTDTEQSPRPEPSLEATVEPSLGPEAEQGLEVEPEPYAEPELEQEPVPVQDPEPSRTRARTGPTLSRGRAIVCVRACARARDS